MAAARFLQYASARYSPSQKRCPVKWNAVTASMISLTYHFYPSCLRFRGFLTPKRLLWGAGFAQALRGNFGPESVMNFGSGVGRVHCSSD